MKFRVWNKKDGWYFKDNQIYNGEVLNHGFYDGSFIFQRATDLKDSKGKLIYEGDILQFKVLNKLIKVDVKFGSYHNNQGVLAYGYYISIPPFDFSYDLIQIVSYPVIYKNVEIVGNIFENDTSSKH